MVHCLHQLFVRSNVAVIVPRKFAKHFESTTKLPIFCFSNSESFNKVTRTFALRPNSYLQPKMDLFIRRAIETGHILKWEANSFQGKKYENDRDGLVALTVEHLSGGILIYVIAMTLAFLCFIGERLAMKSNHRAMKWLDKFLFSTERIIWKNALHSHPEVKDRSGSGQVEPEAETY